MDIMNIACNRAISEAKDDLHFDNIAIYSSISNRSHFACSCGYNKFTNDVLKECPKCGNKFFVEVDDIEYCSVPLKFYPEIIQDDENFLVFKISVKYLFVSDGDLDYGAEDCFDEEYSFLYDKKRKFFCAGICFEDTVSGELVSESNDDGIMHLDEEKYVDNGVETFLVKSSWQYSSYECDNIEYVWFEKENLAFSGLQDIFNLMMKF